MLADEVIAEAQQRTVEMLENTQILLTDEEKKNVEVCDYWLGDWERIGTQIVIYVNTDRCCAKELIMFPHQICPEHYHPPIGDYPGKEETFRCRWGEVYLYVAGEPTPNPKAMIPEERRKHFKVWHEVILRPGEQYTIKEGVPHWFQGGPEGAIVTEFSTTSYDDKDIFTDPDIQRISNLSNS